MERHEIAEEDEVFVSEPYSSDKTAKPGRVTKVGRTLVEIQYQGRRDKFRLDSQIINDAYGRMRFDTAEQMQERERQSAAREALRAVGVRIEPGTKLPAKALEAMLAAAEPNPHRYVAIVRGDQGGTCVQSFTQAGFTRYPADMQQWLDAHGFDGDGEAWLLTWRDGENVGEIANIVALRQFELPAEE